MKARIGFVTNSSSSSFIIAMNLLTEEQVNTIIEKASEIGYRVWHDQYYLEGSIILDEDNLSEIFESIGVEKEYVRWFD